MAGQHRQASGRRWRRVFGIVIAAVTAVVLLVGIGYFVLTRRPVAQPSQPALTPTDALPATAGAAPCTVVRVRAALENAELVRDLVQAYQGARRNIEGHCAQLTVTVDSSGLTTSDVERGFSSVPTAERPDLWVPDSSAWPSLVAERRARQGLPPLVPAQGTSIALSYLVLAMPEVLADIVGWRSAPPTWTTFLESTANRDTWRRLGHPEFGDIKLGKTSPAVASSGLYTLLAEYGAAANDLQSPAVSDISVAFYRARVAATERSVVHYMSTEEHILWHARQVEHSGGPAFLSVVPVSERGMWQYNRGVTSRDGLTYTTDAPPHQPLVPIYPADGTYALDNPGLVLDAPWVTSVERAAAQDFLRFATSRQGQAIARATGYRDLAGTTDPDVASVGHYADSAKLRTLPPPSGELLAAVQASFPAVRKRARVLFLLDMSRSMTEPIYPGMSKLKAAQQAIARALPYFTDDDEVGLAGFSHLPGKRAIVPGLVARVAPLRKGRQAFLGALRSLKAVEATPLFAATAQFTTQMAAEYRPDWINAVVLLSDGHNDTQSYTDTLASMSASITRATKDRPVLIFTLAYANKADVPTLQAIAQLTHAHYYDATNPAHLERVLGDLVTSF